MCASVLRLSCSRDRQWSMRIPRLRARRPPPGRAAANGAGHRPWAAAAAAPLRGGGGASRRSMRSARGMGRERDAPDQASGRPQARAMPYVLCPNCSGLTYAPRSYLNRSEHCPVCDAKLEVGSGLSAFRSGTAERLSPVRGLLGASTAPKRGQDPRASSGGLDNGASHPALEAPAPRRHGRAAG